MNVEIFHQTGSSGNQSWSHNWNQLRFLSIWSRSRNYGMILGKIDLLYLLDISLDLSMGSTKCQDSKVYLVVSSKFYESVVITSQHHGFNAGINRPQSKFSIKM